MRDLWKTSSRIMLTLMVIGLIVVFFWGLGMAIQRHDATLAEQGRREAAECVERVIHTKPGDSDSCPTNTRLVPLDDRILCLCPDSPLLRTLEPPPTATQEPTSL